jgi:cell division protein ZapA (FtsZ GTPase activity inhibitor)
VKRSVTVEVAGQKFQLKTDGDEAYVKSLARYVTEKIDEAKQSARTVTTQSLVILAALNIADDLFQTRRSSSELKRRVRDKSRTILDLLDKEAKLS